MILTDFLRPGASKKGDFLGAKNLVPLAWFGPVFVSGLAWPPLASFGFPLASLERSLGLPWGSLGLFWAPLGLPWASFWFSYGPLEPPLGLTWASFGLPVVFLGSLGPPFGVPWAAFRISWLLFGHFLEGMQGWGDWGQVLAVLEG